MAPTSGRAGLATHLSNQHDTLPAATGEPSAAGRTPLRCHGHLPIHLLRTELPCDVVQPRKSFFMVQAQARQNNGKPTGEAKKIRAFCGHSPSCAWRNGLYLMTSWMTELC